MRNLPNIEEISHNASNLAFCFVLVKRDSGFLALVAYCFIFPILCSAKTQNPYLTV